MRFRSRSLALALAAAFALSYAGPSVCAVLHAPTAAASGHAHHAHHGGGPQWTPGAHDGPTCPDVGHCGLTLVAPVLAAGTIVPPVPALGAPDLSRTALAGVPTTPLTPPPRA